MAFSSPIPGLTLALNLALRMALHLTLILAPAASLTGQDVDSTQAITWLAEFRDACQRVEPIWPQSLCAPSW